MSLFLVIPVNSKPSKGLYFGLVLLCLPPDAFTSSGHAVRLLSVYHRDKHPTSPHVQTSKFDNSLRVEDLSNTMRFSTVSPGVLKTSDYRADTVKTLTTPVGAAAGVQLPEHRWLAQRSLSHRTMHAFVRGLGIHPAHKQTNNTDCKFRVHHFQMTDKLCEGRRFFGMSVPPSRLLYAFACWRPASPLYTR
ncbi:hypothetical protein BDN72DRAFT_831937 [Pluteus cervinus]|uniref:Uncharacterized protein n=1 Tax=Pluteus cervinus TaxID=181527 RepID=A0ACD3BCQ1_9AGAR|nr:hypothetical protein BDN72DRAFT_831937 [Pluteus cervinus]